ncbi:MAG: hypothetical protein ABII90_13020, partial [Bacteroidota bacterium]
MPIGNDFTINYTDRKITHVSGTTVYTVNALYTHLMDTFDEQSQMDDPIPMTAQTPTAYTLTNSWFMDDESMKYLMQGAITADATWDASAYNDGIRVFQFVAAGYVNAIPGDLGLEVGYAGGAPGDTGTLLYYNNTLRKWWVRVDDTGDTFSNTATAIDLDDGVGTGAGTLSKASTTGTCLWANVYTLGTLPSDPYPRLYIGQDGATLEEWWSEGHIDILAKTKESDVEIDNGIIKLFARQGADSYDHYEIDLTAGGRNAVPLATASDLNSITPESYLLYDNEQVAITVGNIIVGSATHARAQVGTLTDWGVTGLLGLYNVANGPFANDEQLRLTSMAGTYLADANGTPGELFFLYDGEVSGGFLLSDAVTGKTSGFTGTVYGIQDNGLSGAAVIGNPTGLFVDDEQVYKTLDVSYALVNGEAVSGVGTYEDYGNIYVRFVNGTLDFDDMGSAFSVGLTVSGTTTSATGVILLISAVVSAGTLTLGNCIGTFIDDENITAVSGAAVVNSVNGLVTSAHTMNKNFTQQAAYPYDVIIDCGGRPLEQVYEYLKLFCQEDSVRPTYGYSGKRILAFAAGGYSNVIDSDIGKVVSGTDTGDTGILKGYNNTSRFWTVQGDSTTDLFDEDEAVTITGGAGVGTMFGASVPDPISGERYIKAWDGYAEVKAAPFGTFAGGIFFGARGIWVEDVHPDDAQSMQLIDANGAQRLPPNFQNVTVTGLEVGDKVGVYKATGDNYIVNKSMFTIDAPQASGVAFVKVDEHAPDDTPATGFIRVVRRAVDGTIEGEERYGYTAWTWGVLTEFTLAGETNYAYDGDDTAYVPYIDDTAAAATLSKQIIYVTPRYVVTRVRNYGGAGSSILPFQTKGAIGPGGYAAA